jgi:transposase
MAPRSVFAAIVYVLRTGWQWKASPGDGKAWTARKAKFHWH